VIIGLVLVTVLVAAGNVAVRWWRFRKVVRGLFGVDSAVSEAMDEMDRGLDGLGRGLDEMARGLEDGGAVSARFVSDLRARRWHEAYQSTSGRFRRQMDEASLQRFVEEGPPLKGPDTPFKFSVMQGPDGASITINGGGSAPDGGVWLLLIGEEGALRVDRLSLGGKTAP
jgi:hypothetical protein